jgi:hypothetical protein
MPPPALTPPLTKIRSVSVRPKRSGSASQKIINFYLREEPPNYVAQCLNVDVSCSGATIDEAVDNLKKAMELYFFGEQNTQF